MPKQGSKLTARQAVERVLRGKRRMTVGQITEAALPLTALNTSQAVRADKSERIVDGTVEVVSEGHWKLFTRSAVATESGY